MNIAESIASALESVRSHKLRSGLTLLSISIGVFAIITSTSITTSLQDTLSSQLTDLGESSFLMMRTPTMQFGNSWRKYRKRKNLTYQQAQELRRQMTLTNYISVSNTNAGLTVQSGLESTNPDVSLIGIDDLYFEVNAVSLSSGRIIAEQDVDLSRNVAIIGNDIVTSLFDNQDPIGKSIVIKNQIFTVIGVLTKKGGVLGQSQDNRVLLPITLFMKYYTPEWDASVDISVKAVTKDALPATIDEARGIMRSLRECKPWEEDNFELETNDAISSQFAGMSNALVYISWFSGFAALIAAGIGIMNMMLVSVRERTREIGVRKALGAQKNWIVRQFLIESVTLSLLGGLCGITLGLLFSLCTTLLARAFEFDLSFSFPWVAVIASVAACTSIGLIAGVYPANKAASLDPIEALRYE